MAEATSSTEDGIHFVVFSHGLWGNPKHLEYFTTQLREAYPSEDTLHILSAKTNIGSLTYDGIELGGERITQEIEEELEKLETEGKQVTKISVIGYSLGGLVSRYAIGLLYLKKWFEKLKPVNFITFATPHLGIRTPLLGFHNDVWNTLGSRTLSASGRQLWTIDNYRDTGSPILSVLASPSGPFIAGLRLFEKRSVYSNIVNDRAVPFYSASISPVDPFANPDTIHINYAPDTSSVILDSDTPAVPRVEAMSFYESLSSTGRTIYHKMPFYLAAAVFLPLGSLFFFANAGWQTFASSQRIKDHESRYDSLLNNMRREAEHAVERLNEAQQEEYLPEESDSTVLVEPEDDDPKKPSGEPLEANGHASPNVDSHPTNKASTATSQTQSSSSSSRGSDEKSKALVPRKENWQEAFPVLALTKEQFSMIETLDSVGFNKYPVHIHKCNHSHAAIILRANRDRFSEGKIVAKHWIERFEI